MESLRVSLWFIFSICLNALGNSLMITANLGSTPWTSAGQNLVTILPLSVGTYIILFNVFSFGVSYLLKVRLNWQTMIKSMLLALVFGFFVDAFVFILNLLFVPENIWIRLLYLLFGLNFIAIALSIYFQLKSVYLPLDYLLQAFAKLKKNYTVGTIICMSIPISISMIIFLVQHHLTGLGIGTILFVFGVGFLIDRYIKMLVINKPSKPSNIGNNI
ncbi:MAG TPA: DUF6198 family protein [Metabacillus sp.]|nr:DUF6198 family protein [Metabacillus sp.]